ncbi:MAG: DUF1343 domain-containing protein [Elusimicrobia bacterium]|nr:DUF1343 domain-containing protein [Elusimicrobiota bacterium]
MKKVFLSVENKFHIAFTAIAVFFAPLFFASALNAYVLTGLDVLKRQDFAQFEGKRAAIVTNQTGVDRSGLSSVDDLFNSRNVKLTAIFTPEHGFRGTATDGEEIGNSTDPVTGLPIYSLYGKTLRPTAAMLSGIDVIFFDIQDVGARFYTYLTTMALCMEEAAKRKIDFVVLDRPNPITGSVLEGPVLDPSVQEFTGYFPVPVRHGLTPGEMALLHKDLRKLDLNLTVIKLQGWDRTMYYDETGLNWVNPSPNIRGVDAAIMYPGIGCFESTNMSVGRGTDSPFIWFGAPWLDAQRLAATLNSSGLEGVRFYAEDRTPSKDAYAGRLCRGIRIEITDRASARPMDIFVRAVCAMRDKRYYGEFRVREAEFRLMAGNNVYKAVYESTDSAEKILADFASQCRDFESYRAKYLLY